MQRERGVETLQNDLKIIKGRTIGILGVAFKPNTHDIRDSPALDIAKQLIARGARVVAHDPIAMARAQTEAHGFGIVFRNSPEDVFIGADAVVLATEWEQYRNLNYRELKSSMRSPVFLDGRNFLDPEELRLQGYRYYAVGRSV
jgi:UDPglucose 6-dehydrogenase